MIGPMMAAAANGLRHYGDFAGREHRRNFWWWVVTCMVVNFVTGILDALFAAPMLGAEFGAEGAGQPLSSLLVLVLLIPSLAICMRRLHDTGRRGWWLLAGLIPLIGWLVLIWLFSRPGDEGANAFGTPVEPIPDP
ncbi:MAG: DUF805 domain-containing protein [Flavobacteriaceae bacterium]